MLVKCHLKTARARIFFYPRHHSRQPEPPPTQRSWGFLNMETIFHISFHQLGDTRLFSTGKLAETCNRCADYVFGQTRHTSQYYKAKWRFLFILNQRCGNAWRWETNCDLIWLIMIHLMAHFACQEWKKASFFDCTWIFWSVQRQGCSSYGSSQGTHTRHTHIHKFWAIKTFHSASCAYLWTVGGNWAPEKTHTDHLLILN